ncbi:MAG: hypothetical protein QOI04_1374 [Verrucomicrobiota bacterium]|jgi:hypothetical protein
MRQTISLLLAALLLIATANRSPAPVTEDSTPTPTPKPKQESTPRPKPKTQSAPKPKAPAGASFAGTWAGNTVNNASDGSSGSASYVIKISNDEKAVLITMGEAGKTVSGPPTPTTCTRFGDALTWSFSASDGTTTYTMKLNSNGTASFLREGRYIGGDLDGITYSHAGTFTKNGAAAPIDSATAASTEVVPQPTPKTGKGGLPVAAPVPNKPGYVYNPFDPNSKILLNVNGKASGSKVKDPFSGKLFIVP